MVTRRLHQSLIGLTGDGRGRLLASIAFGWFLVLGMRFVIPGILPTITDSFGISESEAGVAITVLWITYGLSQLPAGYYVDIIGERILLTTGLLFGAVGLFVFTMTPTFLLFILATGLFGCGSGLFGPPRGTIISKTYQTNDGVAFGIMLAAGSVGAAVLPAAAAILVSQLGWRVTLAGAAPAFILAAVFVWMAIPRTRMRSRQPERSVSKTLSDAVEAVRSYRIAIAVGSAIVMIFVFQSATAFLTVYLVDVKGISQGNAGSVLGILFLVGAASQWIGGGAADRYGISTMLTIIGAVSILPLVVLPHVNGVVALALVSGSIGVRMSIGPLSNAYIIDVLPEPVQGTAWGGIRTVMFLIGSLGSTVVGILIDQDLFETAFYLLAVLTAVGTVGYYYLPDR